MALYFKIAFEIWKSIWKNRRTVERLLFSALGTAFNGLLSCHTEPHMKDKDHPV